MTSYVKQILGYDTKVPQIGVQQGLPASWYRSPELYELERRAIFSKKWMLITHKIRLQKVGDYLRYTEAGFSFFLCLDRHGKINGFHNICRHRGFPLVHEDIGNMKILACRYHGWSYGIDGKLAKAPYFDDVPDFQKSDNGLLPVHVHVDQLGFVWVNLQSAETPSMSWEEQFPGIDRQERFEPFDFSEYSYDHTWIQQADCNWKTLADNYNECLHCRVAHPDTRGLFDLHSYKVEGDQGSLKHFNKRQADGLLETKSAVASTYYFPNACMTVSAHFFYHMRCVPTSATTCSMEYEVYRHKDAVNQDFEHINQFFKRVLAEDKWLCNHTQDSLNAGVYVNGRFHSQHESGPLYFQSLVKDAVIGHRKQEQKLGKDIWPASQRVDEAEVVKELDFCSSLTCDAENRKALSW